MNFNCFIARVSQTISRTVRITLGAVCALAVASLNAPTPLHAAETVLYFHNDISGTPLAATDASGNVVWKETYRPYGERINNAPASGVGRGKNELYFHGKQQEALNNGITIQYFGARYYDPSIGRFLGVDPIHFNEASVHSFNRFAYGNNNPYKFRDPDGRSPESPLMDTVVGDPQSVAVFRGMMYFGEALTFAVPAAQLVRGGVAVYRGLRGAETAAAAGEVAGGIANPVSETLARVVPGNVKPTTLGRAGDADVFVTNAKELRGLSAKQISEKLTIPESSSFRVIEFPSANIQGIASPVNRTNAGFVGRGRTAGGASEFVVPNGSIPKGSVERIVQ
jgi:RHS repeat-associated protein